MKVLHVLNSASGGAALSTLGLINQLKHEGVISSAVCHAGGTEADKQALEDATDGRTLFMPLYWWNKKSRAKWWKRPISEFLQLWRTGFKRSSTRRVTEFAAAHGVELIHSNTILTLEGGYAARLLGLPHVWHLRELVGPGHPYRFSGEGPRFGKFVARFSDRVIANSEVTAQQVRAWLPDGLLEVVPNGIDLSSFANIASRETSHRIVVAMVAGLTCHWKKHLLFVDAAALVNPLLPIEWRIYGIDPSQDGAIRADEYAIGIHDRVVSSGLRERFRFPGHVAPEQIMSEIDILVHPADQESFGRVIVEAMAAGLPVIGVRAGGVAEIVVEEQTGLLVAPDNTAELAGAIEQLATNDNLRKNMGDRGRERALAHYSIDVCAERIVDLYRSLVPCCNAAVIADVT